LLLLVGLCIDTLRRGSSSINRKTLIGTRSHHLLLLCQHHIRVTDLRTKSHLGHLIVDHINTLRKLLLLHHILLTGRSAHHVGVAAHMALVHELLLLSHLKVWIIIHLLLVWVASLHWLHSSLHVLLMLTLILHLLLIVLIGVV